MFQFEVSELNLASELKLTGWKYTNRSLRTEAYELKLMSWSLRDETHELKFTSWVLRVEGYIVRSYRKIEKNLNWKLDFQQFANCLHSRRILLKDGNHFEGCNPIDIGMCDNQTYGWMYWVKTMGKEIDSSDSIRRSPWKNEVKERVVCRFLEEFSLWILNFAFWPVCIIVERRILIILVSTSISRLIKTC